MALHTTAVASGLVALVIKSVRINSSGPEYVSIEGRKSGVLSWLLSLLRLTAAEILCKVLSVLMDLWWAFSARRLLLLVSLI